MAYLLLPFLLLISICNANAYFITVDAYAEECFFDRVEAGTKMGLTFEIADGGFLDIDVRIVGPDNKIIHQVEREGNGKFVFNADVAGDYTYCFSNQKGTMSPKILMFNMYIEKPSKPADEHKEGEDQEGTKANHVDLDRMIKDLSTSLQGVKNEQEYMEVRDKNHRAINESTNFRVVLWSIFEASVLFTMTLGQVFYLKRFFEVRRVV